MLKVNSSSVGKGPQMVRVEFTFAPIAGMTDFVVAVKGDCMYHGEDQVEILDWEFEITDKPHLTSPEIQSSLKLMYTGDLEKDVEAAMKAVVIEDMKEVPAEKPAEVVGAPIDWTAVMRAFDEEFDMNTVLRDAAYDLDKDCIIRDYEVSSGYGNNFTIDAEIESDAIADQMEDSVFDGLRNFCIGKGATAYA